MRIALQSGPRLPHFLVQSASSPPPPTVAAAPVPSSFAAADAASPTAEAATPAAGDELPETLVDPGALYSPLQVLLCWPEHFPYVLHPPLTSPMVLQVATAFMLLSSVWGVCGERGGYI